MAPDLRTSREQVLAFRLTAHNLARRLRPGALLAAAICGLQNSPPGSAELALCARVSGLLPGGLDKALEADKSLLQVRSARTAPHVVPTWDRGAFTLGLLPEKEEDLRFFIRGAVPALDKIGLSGVDAVERTAAAAMDVLDGRTLTFRQLSTELTQRVSTTLTSEQLAHWLSPSWYAQNQSLGEAVIHFALYVVSLKGIICFAKRRGNEACLARTDQWLSSRLTEPRPEAANQPQPDTTPPPDTTPQPDTTPPPAITPPPQAELVRRYLRCYGPATAGDFARWAGISPAAANRAWGLVEPDLVEVDVSGKKTWLLADDQANLLSPLEPEGIRLLPPHDPYLLQTGREMLLADTARHRQIWRLVGNPGAVIYAGQIVAIWRPRKQGTCLTFTVEAFESLSAAVRAEIQDGAEGVAKIRGCVSANVVYGR